MLCGGHRKRPLSDVLDVPPAELTAHSKRSLEKTRNDIENSAQLGSEWNEDGTPSASYAGQPTRNPLDNSENASAFANMQEESGLGYLMGKKMREPNENSTRETAIYETIKKIVMELRSNQVECNVLEKVSKSHIESLLCNFTDALDIQNLPVLQAQNLIAAMASAQSERFEKAARQIADKLAKLGSVITINLPEATMPRHRDSGPSIETAEAGGESRQLMCHLDRNSQLLGCVDALNEYGSHLREYEENYRLQCELELQRKVKMLHQWHQKVEEGFKEEAEARDRMRCVEEQLLQKVRAGGDCVAVGEDASSALQELTLRAAVTRTLNLRKVASNLDLLQEHARCVDLFLEKQDEVNKKQNNLRVVSAFVELASALIDGARLNIAARIQKVQSEVREQRAELETLIREEVVKLAHSLAEYTEFNEARITRANRSAALREHELDEHRSLFRNDAPTETHHLAACVQELRNVVKSSEEGIKRAMELNQAFWNRVNSSLTRTFAVELGQLYGIEVNRAAGGKRCGTLALHSSRGTADTAINSAEDEGRSALAPLVSDNHEAGAGRGSAKIRRDIVDMTEEGGPCQEPEMRQEVLEGCTVM